MELNDFQIFVKQNIIYQLSYLGAIQGFILAVIVLYYPGKKKTSNRLLSLFICVLAYLLVIGRIVEIINTPFIRLLYVLRFLAPIALYLYITSLFQTINWKKQVFHILIPFLDLLVIYGLTSAKLSRLGQDPIWNSIPLATLNLGWFLIVYTLYFTLIHKAIQQYKLKVLQNFSTFNKIGLSWVKQVYLGCIGLIIIDSLVAIFSFVLPNYYTPYHGLINTITYTAFMYFLTIKGNLTPKVYRLHLIKEKNHVTSGSFSREPKAKEILKKDEELNSLAVNIVRLIEKERLYKQMGLSVDEVAARLETQSYLVSQAINSCLGKNFFELINRYRVEEAKKLLKDSSRDHLSLVGIGFEAGFNSKTSFNTSFKKYTGMTPSEFKKTSIKKSVVLSN